MSNCLRQVMTAHANIYQNTLPYANPCWSLEYAGLGIVASRGLLFDRFLVMPFIEAPLNCMYQRMVPGGNPITWLEKSILSKRDSCWLWGLQANHIFGIGFGELRRNEYIPDKDQWFPNRRRWLPQQLCELFRKVMIALGNEQLPTASHDSTC